MALGFVPVRTETDIGWVRRIAAIPLVGPLLMLIGLGLPAALFGFVLERALGHPPTAIQEAIGMALAAAWSTLVWFRFRTRFSVLFIPAPVLFVLMAVAVGSGVLH